ncbi:MAG: ComEA family DNA-binding protein [Arcobacter sp.]|jgi:competence protein ComEA|uniref:Competence protein, ComEA family n=1 Tax=Arcobacter defluvii TaxID=873191 RepID=A0AAE7BGX1_9BACT|nr:MULTISPECIES: helix-hairpin-helix domain-containing protein [Arcobacter]MDY3201188.1 helix-hairpin-helix domain-containing protein [Arcobacter sp.]QKF78883.1 competence protein, ComEA family [Arcobacter defluvii]RXI30716.1 competence protein ComEA [Arcobacter defluvii]BAK74640.1 competence protein ComEA [Arcobacter sp. L]
MKKIVALFALCGSLLFGAINLQTASKEELMSIKGIGEKKAEQIIEYRKTNKIKSPEDLKNIKGFGDSIVTNVEKNVTVKDKAEKTFEETKKEKKKELKESKEKLNKKVEEKAIKTLQK